MQYEMKYPGRYNSKNIARRTGKFIKPKASKARRFQPRSVLKALSPEKKYSFQNVWTAETMDNVAGTPSVAFAMLNTAQGVNQSQRIGLRVLAKHLKMRFVVEASSAQSLCNYRIDLWKDTQPDGANPVWATLYVAGTTDTDNIVAPVQDTARSRFQLLKTHRAPLRSLLASTTGPVSSPEAEHFDFYLPLNEVIKYNATAAANPDGGSNYFLVGWSDVGANTPKVWAMTEFCFTDV